MTDRDATTPGHPFRGHWVQPAPRRFVGRIVLALALMGATAGLGLLLVVQTFDAMAVLVGFTVVALLSYLALSATSPTTVILDGSRLTVRCGRDIEEFDLAGPIRRIRTTGFPNRPNWRLHLESIEGTIIELGPHQIDPDVCSAAIAHYRPSAIPQQRQPVEDSPTMAPADQA